MIISEQDATNSLVKTRAQDSVYMISNSLDIDVVLPGIVN